MTLENKLLSFLTILLAFAAWPVCAATDAENAAPPGLIASAPSPAKAAGISTVELMDGQTLHGRVVEQDANTVTLEMPVHGRVVIERELIRSIIVEKNATITKSGQVWMPEPTRDRYLFIPSGMMLKQGELYLTQQELFVSTITAGITDYVTVLAGAAAPFWFMRDGFNFIAGLKVGFSITDYFHVAGGAETMVIPSGPGSIGLLFGTATVGNGNANASIAVGAPFLLDDRNSRLEKAVIILSGSLRLTRGLALVTENWIITRSDGYNDSFYSTSNPYVVLSLAARIFGERWAVDVGALRIPDANIPVPWVNFSYHWNL